MKGYGSHCRLTAKTLSVIQTVTSTVCHSRNVPVPRKRARRSATLANHSASTPRRRRRVPEGWSRRRRALGSGTSAPRRGEGGPRGPRRRRGGRRRLRVGLRAPVLGQQVVQHV